jgi:heat-inducible transcriptional repressor
MVADDGSVKTRNVKLDIPCDSASVARLAATLNRYLVGHRAEEVTLPTMVAMENAMAEDGALIGPVVKLIYETMNESDRGDLKVSGVDRLLEYPEYADVDRMKDMLTMFEKKDALLDLIATGNDDDGVHIYIGKENTVDGMSNSTLVYRPVKRDGHVVGAIGIIGPCRMNYSKVIETLNQLAEGIDNAMDGNQLK